MSVEYHFAVFSDHHWVLDDAVMTGRDHDHLLGTYNDLLIVLTNERLRADLELCHIAVLIEHVDVVVRWNTVDALRFRVCLL